MAFDTTLEAEAAAKAEVKGAGMPTPELEKQIEFEKTGHMSDDDTHSHDDDGSLRIPTEEELATLRRTPDKIPWICFTVAFVELCERFAYYGTTAICKRAQFASSM